MPKDGGKDVFVHITAVQAAGLKGRTTGRTSPMTSSWSEARPPLRTEAALRPATGICREADPGGRDCPLLWRVSGTRLLRWHPLPGRGVVPDRRAACRASRTPSKGNRRPGHARVQAWRAGSWRRGQGAQPRQAIAIALHEAGSSNEQSPAQNRRALKRTEFARAARAGAGGGRAEPSRAVRAGQAGRYPRPLEDDEGRAQLRSSASIRARRAQTGRG